MTLNTIITCLITSFLLLRDLLAESPTEESFIKYGKWNSYCNTSLYGNLYSGKAVILRASVPFQQFQVYGSCLLSFGSTESSVLYLTFLEYPAFHECSNGELAIYERIGDLTSILWEGQCGDSPHFWHNRSVTSKTADIWIWYNKFEEWPETVPYKEIDFSLLIATNPMEHKCNESLCNHQGSCLSRGAAPPRHLMNFSADRLFWFCNCRYPYSGAFCSEKFINQNSCEMGLCLNNGRCFVDMYSANGYSCLCERTHTGANCEHDMTVCSNVCGEGGTCQEVDGKMMCVCSHDSEGERCTDRIPCQSYACQNNGTCAINGTSNYRCICQEPYTGTRCESSVTSDTGYHQQQGVVTDLRGGNNENSESLLALRRLSVGFMLTALFLLLLLLLVILISVYHNGKGQSTVNAKETAVGIDLSLKSKPPDQHLTHGDQTHHILKSSVVKRGQLHSKTIYMGSTNQRRAKRHMRLNSKVIKSKFNSSAGSSESLRTVYYDANQTMDRIPSFVTAKEVVSIEEPVDFTTRSSITQYKDLEDQSNHSNDGIQYGVADSTAVGVDKARQMEEQRRSSDDSAKSISQSRDDIGLW